MSEGWGSTSSVNEINSYAATYFAIYWYINALQTYFAYSSCGKLRSSYVFFDVLRRNAMQSGENCSA